MKLIDLIKNNIVSFNSYRAGFFYYNLLGNWNDFLEYYETNYLFTIPIEDVGNSTLLNEDKAITFMRWIRKALESNTLIKQ